MITKVCRSAVLAVLCGVVVAETASAATLHGIVVHRNHHAHSFVVSLRGGRLASVHARRSPRLGRTVGVTAVPMHNGTWRATKVRSGPTARHATLRGVVTFVNRRHGVFTLSAGGASLLIHRQLSHNARAADGLPDVGQNLTVRTGIDEQGNLDEESIRDHGEQASGIELEGVVMAASANTISVSADDDDQSRQTVVVDVPATFDISAFAVGQEVKLLVTRQLDGSFLLEGSAEDDNSREANDPGDSQGRGGGCRDSRHGSSCMSDNGGTNGGTSGDDNGADHGGTTGTDHGGTPGDNEGTTHDNGGDGTTAAPESES